MILTYNDCKNKYGSQYNINKAIIIDEWKRIKEIK